METKKFQTVLLGIVYDPKEKKILIGKRIKDAIKKLKWCFPGGKPNPEQTLEDSLKNRIKAKTGYDTESLGSVFVRIAPEKKDQILIYYLCETLGGQETPGDDLEELKWVTPEELEEYITTSFHPHLREYILNLK